MPWIWKYLMEKISLKANFDHKHGYFLWQVVAGVVSTNGYWCCSSKSLIKSIALWSGFCEVKTPWSMSYAVRNVQEPTSSRDSLMCLWPPDPKPRTFTLKALLAVFTLASLKFFTSKAGHTHSVLVCDIEELYRVTLCIIMVWYTKLRMAKV